MIFFPYKKRRSKTAGINPSVYLPYISPSPIIYKVLFIVQKPIFDIILTYLSCFIHIFLYSLIYTRVKIFFIKYKFHMPNIFVQFDLDEQEKIRKEQTDVGQIPQFCEYSVRRKSTV